MKYYDDCNQYSFIIIMFAQTIFLIQSNALFLKANINYANNHYNTSFQLIIQRNLTKIHK